MRMVLWLAMPLCCLVFLAGCGERAASEAVLCRVGESDVTLTEFQRAFGEAVAAGEGVTADSASARRFLRDYQSKVLLEQIATDSVAWIPIFEHRVVSFLETMMVHQMRREAYGFAAQVEDDDLRKVHAKGEVLYNYRAIPFATREEAMQKLLNVREGAAFVPMADQILGRNDGGAMGWQSIMNAPESIVDELARLKPSEVGGPVETGGAFHLVQLIEKAPNPDLPTFDDAKHALKIRIAQDRGGTLLRRFQKELLEKYKQENRMAEILWISQWLYDETKDTPRQFNPKVSGQMGGMAVSDPEAQPKPPWTQDQPPFTEEEAERILSVSTVDTIRAVLFLDHVLSKPVFNWPSFERPEDVLALLRELVIQRLERIEAWERGYHNDPDLAWKAEKRRKLIHTRQFVHNSIYARTAPTLDEARAWYEGRMSLAAGQGKRRYIMVTLTSLEAARQAREILAAESDPTQAYERIKTFDPKASWTGAGGFPVSEDQVQSDLDREIFRIKAGQVTQPYRVGDYYAVARLEDISRGGRPMGRPFDEVEDQIVVQLAEARIDSVLSIYLAERRAITPIVVDEEVFKQIRYDQAAQAG